MTRARAMALGFQFRAPTRGLTDAIRRARREQARRHIEEYIAWVMSDRERAMVAGFHEMARCANLSPEDMERCRERVREMARRPRGEKHEQ